MATIFSSLKKLVQLHDRKPNKIYYSQSNLGHPGEQLSENGIYLDFKDLGIGCVIEEHQPLLFTTWARCHCSYRILLVTLDLFQFLNVSRSFLDRVISTWQNWKLGNMRLWLQRNWVCLLVLSGQVGVHQHDSHGLKEFAPDKTENLTLYTLIQFNSNFEMA